MNQGSYEHLGAMRLADGVDVLELPVRGVTGHTIVHQMAYDMDAAVRSPKKLTRCDIEKVICYHDVGYAKTVNERVAELASRWNITPRKRFFDEPQTGGCSPEQLI
jgi:hypothetical protein